MLRNAERWFDDDDLVAIGRSVFKHRALRFVFGIARLLMTPMGFHRWLNKPRDGVGNQFFTCVTPTFRELGPDTCDLELALPPGHEVASGFFLITKGNLIEMSTLFGYQPSEVTLEPLPHGARYRVRIPTKRTLRGRLWAALTWPFAARAVARELKAANETLVGQNEELQTANHDLENYRTNLEKLVDERTAQLREAQGAREKFFSHISHEIRTPLSLVILAAGDVESRGRDVLDTRAKQSLGSITDAARRLLRLVDELLLLAAGQEDKLELHKTPTDLVASLVQLHAAWRPAAENAGLELALRAPGKLVAKVDAVALERIATNLVSNAVKYTPREGSVAIELVDEPDGVRLSVFDTGVGIDAELGTRLFRRFERAKSAETLAVGTGIGLSLVKQLVEAHGGTIEALPRDAGGTEMRVMLPPCVRTDEPVSTRSPRVLDRVTVPPPISSGQVFEARGISAGTILLAEDDPFLADQIATLLSERYTVVVGLDGQAALDLVGKHQPQLLITDVDMPRMTGLELAPRFRATVGDQLAPIIILSAVTDLGTRVAGLQAGAIDYVSKPFDPRELEARVHAQFRMRDLALRLYRAEQVSTLGMLTSGLAHELRNPANGIVNAIEPIREMLPATTPKGVSSLLDVLQDCAEQIGFMSSQLLGFRGGAALELHPANANELITRAASLAGRSLTGVTLKSPPGQERSVMCAPQLFVQVLSNLIENGAHAAGKGGWVEVRVQKSDTGGTVFEVTDSGQGVPVAIRDKIFEPFFTTKPQGVGTGLGLSVARAIVQRHAGLLEVRERGDQTAFVIELPDTRAA